MSELTDDRPRDPILTSQGGIPYNKPWLDYWERRALKAEAALRAAASTSTEGAGVKGLEWDDGEILSAETPFGRYDISSYGKYWALYFDNNLVQEWPALVDTAEAKAAAQADYEARIRSALNPPAPKVTTDEAEERG